MLSEGQKHEAIYNYVIKVLIRYNISFLHFVNHIITKRRMLNQGCESHQCLKEGDIPFKSATV